MKRATPNQGPCMCHQHCRECGGVIDTRPHYPWWVSPYYQPAPVWYGFNYSVGTGTIGTPIAGTMGGGSVTLENVTTTSGLGTWTGTTLKP